MSIYESTMRPACVLAAVIWVVAWSIIIANVIWHIDGLGFVGTGLIATGAMIQIRGYYVSVCRKFDDHQLAFDMGKEIGKQSGVRPLR